MEPDKPTSSRVRRLVFSVATALSLALLSVPGVVPAGGDGDHCCSSEQMRFETVAAGVHSTHGHHGADPGVADTHAHHRHMLESTGFDRSVHSYAPPDLVVVDMMGQAISLHQILETDQPVILNFIFTTCTTICPVLSATFSQVQKQLDMEQDAVRMISITIDPEHDTPERLQDYAARYHADPRWRFLTGNLDNIIAIQKAFDAYRGTKLNHEPITFLRGSGGDSWVRLEGMASAAEVIGEYRKLEYE